MRFSSKSIFDFLIEFYLLSYSILLYSSFICFYSLYFDSITDFISDDRGGDLGPK